MTSNNEDKFEFLIKEAYPVIKYVKEKTIWYNSQKLRFDFFIPSLDLFIEIQGQQHYSYNKFFYKNKFDFTKQLSRDRLKEEWCDLNNYYYLCISEKEIKNMDAQTLKNLIKKTVSLC